MSKKDKPSVMDNHVVRAKKEYTCNHCGSPVFVSQRHIKYVWRDKARKLHSEHVHIRCYADMIGE